MTSKSPIRQSATLIGRESPCLPRPAFTLTEVIIVVLILGIMASAAAPIFSKSLERYRLESVAQRLVVDLRAARTLARISGRNVTVQLDLQNHMYAIPGLKSLDGPDQTYTVDLNSIPYGCPLDEVTWQSWAEMETVKNLVIESENPVQQSSSLELVFDRFEAVDQGGQIVLRRGTQTRTIAITSASGEVQLQ